MKTTPTQLRSRPFPVGGVWGRRSSLAADDKYDNGQPYRDATESLFCRSKLCSHHGEAADPWRQVARKTAPFCPRLSALRCGDLNLV